VRHDVGWLEDADAFGTWFPTAEQLLEETTDEQALALVEEHLVEYEPEVPSPAHSIPQCHCR